MAINLKEKLSLLPPLPGVYLMKDAGGGIIYVGKAQNLKKRISSYFRRPEQLDPKTGMLVQKLATHRKRGLDFRVEPDQTASAEVQRHIKRR